MHDSSLTDKSDRNLNLDILLLVWIGSWNIQPIPHIGYVLLQYITPPSFIL